MVQNNIHGLVSIIMPAYNSSTYIKDSIESVLHQTYVFWELIIVDDCSNDNTEAIVKAYKDERIIFIKNITNCGAAVSRNLAISRAHGEWVAFLDSDDLWYPEKLEKQIVFMQSNGYDFSYTGYREIDSNGVLNGRKVVGPKHITKRGMYNYCWPGCLTVMYNAKHIGIVQVPDIRKNNDYAMWLRVIKKSDCYFLDEILAQYRRHDGSISNHYYHHLIKWHYLLFRIVENQGVVSSLFYTLRNMFFGVVKKLFYVKRNE